MDDDALTDPAPSAPVSPICTSPTSCDLMDSYLPKDTGDKESMSTPPTRCDELSAGCSKQVQPAFPFRRFRTKIRNVQMPPLSSAVTTFNRKKRKLVLDGHRPLALTADRDSAASCNTDSDYVLPTETTTPSVNDHPNLRNKDVSSMSNVRIALFQGPGHQDHTGQDLLVGSDESSTLPIDGIAVAMPTTVIPPEAYPDKRHEATMLESGNSVLAKEDKT